MSSKGKRRSDSSKPALSSEAQQNERDFPSAAESSPEPVPAQETMDQSSKSMVPTSSSSDHSPPPSSTPSDSEGTLNATSKDDSSTHQTASPQSDPSETATMHTQPIPPASEPTQYRAIGLIRAKYVPSAKQFSRGQLVTDDECTFNAVLLGRVMSLVKKHLDPESNHLWVVYPRTREKTCDLHVQIVGVWEPETLDRSPEDSDGSDNNTMDAEQEPAADAESAVESSSPPEDQSVEAAVTGATPPKAPMPPKPPATPAAKKKEIDYTPLDTPGDPEDGYFSIRGEVVNIAQNPDRVTIKIQQSPRKGEDEGRSFRIMLMGSLEGRTLGHFWELNVRRQGLDLTIEDGQRICVVQPRKYPKGSRSMGPGSRGPSTKSAPRRPGGSPRPTPRPVPSSASASEESTESTKIEPPKAASDSKDSAAVDHPPDTAND